MFNYYKIWRQYVTIIRSGDNVLTIKHLEIVFNYYKIWRQYVTIIRSGDNILTIKKSRDSVQLL